MIYVALVEAAALVLLAALFGGILRSLIRQQARERDLLLNKIMHLAGATWETPPAEQLPVEEPEEAERYSATPEQFFDADYPVPG